MPAEIRPRLDYDRIAHLYDAQPHRDKAPDPHLLHLARAHPARGTALAVLDIGCGTGNQLLVNRTSLPDARFVGLDRFAGMLAQAKRKADGITHLQWVQADGAALPFAGDTFDFVSSQFSFHHVRDKRAMIRSVWRVLRPGGRFAIVNICPREMPTWLIYRAFPSARQADLRDFEPHGELVTQMAQAGFVNIDVDLDHLETEQTLDEFLESVRRRDGCSQLMAISDADYESGLRRLEAQQRKTRGQVSLGDQICLLTIGAEKGRGAAEKTGSGC